MVQTTEAMATSILQVAFVMSFFLHFPSFISASKVGQRWSGKSSNRTLTVVVSTLSPGRFNGSIGTKLPPETFEYYSLVSRPFMDIEVFENIGGKVGERLPNGSFDGLIGAAVALKVDMVFGLVDPRMIDPDLGVPGRYGPVAFDGQMAILSSGQPPQKVESSLLSFIIDSVELNLYKYLVIWTILFVTIHTIFVVTFRTKSRINPMKIVNQFMNNFWMVAEIVLITESTVKPRIKIRKVVSLTVLTFSMIICVYYALDIVIWNHLTAHLSMELSYKFIDNIQDLINATKPDGSLIIPAISLDYGANNYLKTSQNQDEQELLKYINQFPPNVSKVTFNKVGDQYNKYFSFLSKIAIGDIAYIELDHRMSKTPVVLCYHQPELVKRIHISKDKFGGGYNTYFFGPDMDIDCFNDMKFHMTNLIEMGFLWEGVIRKLMRDYVMARSDFVDSVIEGMKCEDEYIEKVNRDPRYDPQQVVSFDLMVMKDVFKILVHGMVMSSFVIVAEKYLFKLFALIKE